MSKNKFSICFLFVFSLISFIFADEPKKDSTPIDFTQEEISTFISTGFESIQSLLENNKDYDSKKIEEIKTVLINRLKQYKVDGVSFSVTLDPNIAFFYDTINPDIKITYKDNKENFITKEYNSSIKSIGLKFEAAFVLDFIFILGTNLNLFNSKDVIKIGSGFSLNLNPGCLGLTITYASIKNGPGGILILSIPIGASAGLASYVIGGTLTAK